MSRLSHLMTRRQFVAASLASMLIPTGSPAASVPRLAVLDWAWAETALVLGATPDAVAEAPLYQDRVVAPPLPPGTIDLGLRSWPNMELLRSLRPDAILSQADYGVPLPVLEAIAPTLALPLFTAERRPLHFAEAGMRTIAELLGRKVQADAYLRAFERTMSDIRANLRTYDGRPLLIVKFADDRLADIYGQGSLFHEVLDRLGLANAWQGAGSRWGFSTAGLDAVAGNAEARLVIIEPGPPSALVGSGLWKAIPAVRSGRVVTIPPTWVFGGLPSALRFAGIIGRALTS